MWPYNSVYSQSTVYTKAIDDSCPSRTHSIRPVLFSHPLADKDSQYPVARSLENSTNTKQLTALMFPRAVLRNVSRGIRRYSVSQKSSRTQIFPTVAFASVTVGIASYLYGRRQIQDNPPEDLFPKSSTTKLEEISPPRYCSDAELSQAIQEIKAITGEANVTNSAVELQNHTDSPFTPLSPLPHQKPKWVVYGTSTEEISEIMKILHKYNVPVVPFSGGTALEGHFFSTRPGVVLDTSRMNKVLKVNHDDLDVVLEAGVNWVELNKQLDDKQLMFGCDCGPNGLIGGMVNTNASGINASRYGAMVQNVVSLTVVLADGTIIKTKQRPRKSSAGYNLTGLFIGSEGTLGIVTEATLKLHVKPLHETVVVGQFPTILDTTNTVAELFRQGVHPEAIELLDKDMMHCINYSGYFTKEWLEVPTLFFKVGGLSKAVVEESLQRIAEVSKMNNCKDFIIAKDKAEEEELFSARKNAFYAALDYCKNEIHEDARLWVTDVAVPLSNLSPVLEEIRLMIQESGLESIILGHVGDGNFHADIFYAPSQEEQCKVLVEKITLLGLANEGTASGEHGIGNGKRKYLPIELGQDAVDTMRKVKMALDPKRLLNPDKIFKIDPNDEGKY